MNYFLITLFLSVYLFINPIFSYAGEIFQQHMPAKKFQDPKSRFLSGSIYKLSWPQIEPEEGKFKWEIFEKDPLVTATKKRGKKLAVKIRLQGDKNWPTIPHWIGAKIVEGTDQYGRYTYWPVFWDKTFQEKLANFLKALAARYDGDPTIEFFWFGETALGYSRAEKEWISVGFTDVGVYKNALIEVCKTYKKYFKKTPLMLMLNKFRKSSQEWFKEHPEDIKAMWEFVDFLVKEEMYIGTVSFYQSEEELNDHDRIIIWPIFKEYQGKTKIIVMIDRPHFEKIKDPLQAMKNLFLSYKVDYLFVDPKLIYDKKWTEAFKYAKEYLERR